MSGTAQLSAMEQLRSLLGIWYTDSPTWPPAPGVKKAIELAEKAEREYTESLAVYIGQIKEQARRDGCRTCHRPWEECIC